MDQDAEPIIAAIQKLLEEGGAPDWASTFERLGERMLRDPEGAKREARALYGGMGSFNDLVVFRDGRADPERNDALDELRARLYELCRR